MLTYNPLDASMIPPEDNTMIKRVVYLKYLEAAENEGFEPFDFDWFCNNDYEDMEMMKSLLPKNLFKWYKEEHSKELKLRQKTSLTGNLIF